MAVLVTGGAGYIGSHFVLALKDRGEQVVVLDDLSRGFRRLVPEGVALEVGDIADASLVRDIVRSHDVDAVAHFAARIVVPESVADPLGYYLANTAKTRSLLEAAIEAGVRRLIFSSTAAVYGNVGSEPVTETAPLAPVSPYGRSKLMSEWMIEDAGKASGLRALVLRYFNVAGADPRGRSGQCTPNATHLIKVAVQTALGIRSSMDLFGTDYPTPDGTCLRDYIQVSDLAAAHIAGLDHLRGGGESLTLNCGYGRGYSVREVIDTVKRVSGRDFEVRLSPRRPGDPASIVAEVESIHRHLAWRPAYDDLETIVRQSLAWEERLMQEAAGAA